MLGLLNGLQGGNRSGTGRYTAELARRLPGLAGAGEVAVLWPGDLPLPGSSVEEAFVRVPSGGGLRRVLYDQVGLRKERKRLGAEVVHYPANVGNVVPMGRSVLTVHDLSFFRVPSWFTGLRGGYYRMAVGRSVALARRIIADSRCTADDLMARLGVAAARIDVIPLGVDEAFKPIGEEARGGVREKYGLPERFFLFVGTLEPRKNVACLIRAWSSIAAGCDFDLVVAGREGWKTGPIRRAAAESPFSDRLYFPGFVAHEDLPGLLSAARAFVWPSLWEGFGLPVLEAMACGTPVLTSNRGSLPEVAGEAAVLVDPDDVGAVAEGMRRVGDDEGLRGALRAEGLRRARAYRWEATAAMTLESYRKALKD